ncbi:hypothetical protein IQ244_26895 [Nostoc sp. LEGE 06077]|uniref:hypothetical protein n=1 Tax=Nostoc sp. LEGE 06077 TaxID=915325 RepID=UPI0018820A8C|nr:hypothetical protein [Nostoc sp. LEGE 06077]MBE9210057.1 hypothetical protein [Nostoc sp. LEGE 06077]
MTTALKAIKGGQNKGNHKQPTEEKPVRPHCKISIEDINWVRQQPPCVQQLWLDSVAAEQFGGSAHKLDTNLTYKSLQKAGAALTAQGLFQFEEVFGRLPSGRPGLIGYRVRNLHGYYNRFYWESSTSGETNSCDEKAVHAGKEINHAEANQNQPEVKQIHADLDHFQKNGQKTQDLQGFQKPNNVSNYSLTTYQQPTKVVGKVVSSSTPNENLHGDETAIASLRDASPQTLKSVEEEKEELPAVTDCTTLTLVDDVPSQSASLIEKNQDLGDEQEISHEDNFSAAPANSNLENLSQHQDQAQQSQSTSLLVEKQELGDDVITPHEDNFSAAPVAVNSENPSHPQNQAQPSLSASLRDATRTLVEKKQELGDDTFPEGVAAGIASHEDTLSAAPAVPKNSHSTSSSQEPKAHSEGVCAVTADSDPEKWSYEAVVERSRVRPWRMEKLKMAEQWRENPGDDFLMECWADDPALRIVIKKLVAKCPQWGLVAADGVLVKWND